jgi:RND family efflux transporter MFP subunit
MSELQNTKQAHTTRRTVWIYVAIAIIFAGSIGYFIGNRGTGLVNSSVSTKDGTESEAASTKKMLYTCGMHPWIIAEEPGLCPICSMKLTPKRDDADASAQTARGTERKISYWRAPMNPTEIYEKPGKSAMGMDLVPVYEDEMIGGVEIRVDPVVQQNMGIRTEKAVMGPLEYTIRTYGHITYDETRIAEISPRFGGWFEKLYVDFTGQSVKKGQPLFEIYSPELLTAQEEYLVALKNFRRQPTKARGEMFASVEKRLMLFGVPQKEIQAIKNSGKTKRNITIFSQFSGIVVHKNAVLGGYVKAGTPIYRIADLRRVWVEAHIYEYELERVHTGLEATMKLPYMPGKVFKGDVTYVYPYLQQKTRDVVIRLEFDNHGFELKPEMYANIFIKTLGSKQGTIIPEESVIRSGERNIVFVTRGTGKFTPRNVTLGMQVDGGKVQVLTGIAPGENVVTSGQFLLDSESKLKEAVQKMLAVKKTAVSSPSSTDKDDFFEDMKSEDDFFEEMDSND